MNRLKLFALIISTAFLGAALPLWQSFAQVPSAWNPLVGIGYCPNTVAFDGSTRVFLGSGLTGAADSKLLTIFTWFKTNTNGAATRFIQSDGASPGNLRYSKSSTNNVTLLIGDTAGAAALSIASTAGGVLSSGGYYSVLISVDMANTSKRHLYINDVSDLTVTIYNNATLDLTKADWAVGFDGGSTLHFDGDMANLMVWFGTYVDFSTTSNRRLFIDPNNRPIDPRVAIAALGSPIMGFSGPTSTWQNNLLGTGGPFSVTAGSLTTALKPPC